MTWGPCPALGVMGTREGLGLLRAGSPSSRALHTPGARRVNRVPPPAINTTYVCPTRMSSEGYFGWVPAASGMCLSEDPGCVCVCVCDITVTSAAWTQHLLRVTQQHPESAQPPISERGGLGGGSAQARSGQGSPHITPSPGPSFSPSLGGGGGWSLAPHGELSLVLLLWSRSGHF